MSARRALRVGAVLRALRESGVQICKVYLMEHELQVVCFSCGYKFTEVYAL